jgi:hypothetical protein
MKTIILVMFFLGFQSVFYAQIDKTDKNSKTTKMKTEELPELVITKAEKDFSDYIPSIDTDDKIKILQEKFIGYNLQRNEEGFNTYLVVMKVKEGSLVARYDENGKLFNVVEKYKNVKLPSVVIYSVLNNFPGWSIVNDQFLYSQEKGDILRNQYNIKIKKDRKIRKIVVHPDGNIVKGIRKVV